MDDLDLDLLARVPNGADRAQWIQGLAELAVDMLAGNDTSAAAALEALRRMMPRRFPPEAKSLDGWYFARHRTEDEERPVRFKGGDGQLLDGCWAPAWTFRFGRSFERCERHGRPAQAARALAQPHAVLPPCPGRWVALNGQELNVILQAGQLRAGMPGEPTLTYEEIAAIPWAMDPDNPSKAWRKA